LNGDTLLKMKDISKSFPGVRALDGVDFDVNEGEIVALVGENGAGKSTLIKILAGIYQRDSGKIIISGEEVHPDNPGDSINLGISVIHQELNLVPEMNILENIFLGQEIRSSSGLGRMLRRLDANAMKLKTQQTLKRLGVSMDPFTPIKELSVAQQQLVEIAKALSLNARILVMDEPTSSLAEKDVDSLLELMKTLREQGVTIVFITHRLDEVFKIADRAVVLRDGKSVGQKHIKDTTKEEIISMMVGRVLDQLFPKIEIDIGNPVLEVKNLNRGRLVRNVEFEIRQGEIVGLSGLVGSGRTEMARALFGIDKRDSGDFLIDGEPVQLDSPRRSIRAGIGFVPEDRKSQGLILRMAIYQNMTLPSIHEYTSMGYLNRREELKTTQRFIKDLQIRTTGPKAIVHFLSGGNQQKVVLGKWLAMNPKILILDEPTRGVDVGAKAEIHALISRFAQQGMGILLISSELPEILGMCDRVLVMSQGTIVANYGREDATQENIMKKAVGTV